MCYSCHGNDGRGTPLPGGAPGAMLAPPLAGSPRVNGHRDYIIKVLLKGLTGPLGEGSGSMSDIMLPMGSNTDQWIAGVASYVRSSFGNPGGIVTVADVARLRAATASRKTPWTYKELEPTLPKRLEGQSTWKLTASNNAEQAGQALFAVRPWSSGGPQTAGMWFQIELPQPAAVTEVEFDSPAPAPARGAGAGRAGGAPAAPVVPFPRAYKVETSLDGVKWSAKPVAEGKGNGTHTSIAFAPVRAKFVRITQTDPAAGPGDWVIASLKVHEAGVPAAR